MVPGNKDPAEDTGCLGPLMGTAGARFAVRMLGHRIGLEHLDRGMWELEVRLRSLVVRLGPGMVLDRAGNRPLLGDRTGCIVATDRIAGADRIAVVVGSPDAAAAAAVGSLDRTEQGRRSHRMAPESRIAGFRTDRMDWTL